MGIFSGKLNSGNVGAFGQGAIQGLNNDQELQAKYLANQQNQQLLQKQQLQNQGNQGLYNQNVDFYNKQNPDAAQAQHFQAQTGSVFDPVRERISNMLQTAHQTYQKVFGGQQGQTNPAAAQSGPPNAHAAGPAAQSTTPQGSNVAMSRPSPTSSNGTAGPPGATGPMPLPQTQGSSFAEGGAIPGRKGLKARKAKPGNLAKPTQGEKQVAQTNMPQPPATGGADEGPPRNTEPSPSNQDPNLSFADGGAADAGTAMTAGMPTAEYHAVEADADGGEAGKPKKWIGKAIKKPGALHRDLGVPQGEKIPKSKIKAAEQGGGKTAQRARLAETMSKWKDGGMPALPKLQPGAAPEPKPAPRSLEQDVSNDGQRGRLGKTIKRFADGGDPVPTPTGMKLPPHEDPSAMSDLSQWNAQQPEYAGMTPPGTQAPPSPGKGQSPPQSSLASAATSAGAEGVLPPRTATPRQLPYEADRTAANAKLRGGGYQEDPFAAGPPAPVPGAEQRGQNLVDAVNADHLVSGGGTAPAHAGAQPEMQGPPSPDKIDFSQVQIDHTKIPTTTTQDWQMLERATALQLAANGNPNASREANASITGMQHDNFMDYMRQGAALDASGNKQGAMAAYKTAYNYFPTGHDMHFGIGSDGNIVGFGVNEQTGQPVQNGAVRLDQQAVHGIMTHFSNPENFINEGLRMQASANETAHLTKGQIPVEQATAGKLQLQGQYYGDKNATTLATAQIRADSALARLHPAQQDQFRQGLQSYGVQDPQALDAAAQLELQMNPTHDHALQDQIIGEIGAAYAPGVTPEQREEYFRMKGIHLPQAGQNTTQNTPVPNRNDDPMRAYWALGGG